jgi:hypothetical protein
MSGSDINRIYLPIILALLCGAMTFGLWLFEPLGLDSQEWSFVDMPSVPMTVVIFFAAGLVPAVGLTLFLPRLRLWIGSDSGEESAFSRGIFLGPIGGLLLVLTCLPGLGRVGYHQAGAAVEILFFFILVPSAFLGGLAGVYLQRRLRQGALIPVMVFASAMAGYLFLKMVVRIVI